MVDRIVPACLEDGEEAVEIGAGIGARVLQRIAYAGLRGQVDHHLRPEADEGGLHRVVVGDVDLPEGEAVSGEKPVEPGLLQRRVVIGREIVEAEHRRPGIEQRFGDVKADETGGARQQDSFERRASVHTTLCWQDMRDVAWPRRRSAAVWRIWQGDRPTMPPIENRVSASPLPRSRDSRRAALPLPEMTALRHRRAAPAHCPRRGNARWCRCPGSGASRRSGRAR